MKKLNKSCQILKDIRKTAFLVLMFFIGIGYNSIYAQDVPLTVVNTFYGNYDSNTHGVSFYPDITTNSFDIDLPTCTNGSPANIVNAYFIWQQRWRSNFNDLVTTPVFDNTFDAQFNGGSNETITATAEYESRTPSGSDRIMYLFTGYADVTGDISSWLNAGTNSINISNLDIPTPNPSNAVSLIRENWGLSLVLIYECAEYPEMTIEISAGSDFFWCENSQETNDNYSHINSFTFPATTAVINGTLEGVFGGSNNGTAPFRGGDICYITGTGTPPTSSGTAIAPTGDVVNDGSAICSPNPTWVANLGTEWDEFSTPVSLPIGTEYLSVQSHSEENVGVSDACGSLAAATYIFKFEGNPYQIATCLPNTVTICDDASNSTTLSADAGLTGYQWYNEVGMLVGETNQTLIVDSNTAGMSDGSEEFYYEATDGNSCPGALCCPVSVVTESCGPPTGCNNPTIGSNQPTCSNTSGCVGGNTFEDYNCNGIDDAEPKVGGIVVNVYDCDNNLVGTTITDAEGDWQVCSLTDGTAYRIEFVLPSEISCWATPTHVAGSGNQSDVQFLTAPACTQFSVSNPSNYSQADPPVATTCYISGDPLPAGSAAGTDIALLAFPNSASGIKGSGGTAGTTYAISSEIGTTYGLAYKPTTKDLFVSAFLKRHSGLGPNGLGAIYKYNADTGNTTLFSDLTTYGINFGTVPSNSARGLSTDPTDPSTDATVFPLIYKAGIGDLDISDDNQDLFLSNLHDRKIYQLSINDIENSTAGYMPVSYDIPSISCNAGEARPFGLKYYRGKLYVGITCTGENGGSTSDLVAYVYTLEIATGSWSSGAILTIPLDYNKGAVKESDQRNNQPWSDDQNDFIFNSFINFPQAILADIEIDVEGSMHLGIRDRTGDMTGFSNSSPNGSTTSGWIGNAGGDILRAYYDGTTHTLENNGTAGPYTSSGTAGGTNNGVFNVFVGPGGANSQQGPGDGEFYWEDYFYENASRGYVHSEISLGALGHLYGSNEIALNVFDPLDGRFFAGGIQWYDITNGSRRTENYEIFNSGFSGNDGGITFAKANGLGDLEYLSDAAPLEIGNYVWCDSLANGIQDACERGINGITVQLYDRNGVLVGLTQTSNSGQYYFNETNVDTTGVNTNGTAMTAFTGMSYATQYFIVFGDSQFASSEFTVGGNVYGITSVVNTGSNDNIDSDVDGASLTAGSLGSRPDGLPFINMTTASNGCGDHKYDMGVTCTNCMLTDAGETLETCNNNNTTADPIDDYITFSLNPVGTGLSASYTVTANNGGIVTLAAGGAASAVNYGSATAFRLQNGSADGSTNYMITVTDDADNSCQITTMVMQNSCGSAVCMMTITEMTQSNCQDNGTTTIDTDDYFTIDVNATATNGGTQYQAVLNANSDGTGGTVLGTTNYGQVLTLGNGSNGATGTFAANGTTTYTITLRDATDNTCHDEFTTTIVNNCNSCPSITNPSPALTICEGQTISMLSINTNATTSNIEFVYFTTPQTGNAAYSGGTSLATVTPTTGVASISNVVDLMSAGTYYVYARLSPAPTDVACRPSTEIIVTVNPIPDLTLMVSDTTVCDETDGTALIFNSELGVTYQLREDTNDSPVGSPITGTGATIQLPFTNLTPVGTRTFNILATNGTTGCEAELTDKAVITIEPCDFTFPLPTCQFPPCHFTSTDIYLGAEVTNDDPDTGESGTDDGVTYPNNIRPGINVRFPVTIYNNTGQTAYLSGWVDWNGDGDFDDADEQIAQETYAAVAPNTGSFIVSIPVNVPSNAIKDTDLAVRWRLSSDPSISFSPCGVQSCAADGEVEDYLIQVECPPEVCLPVQISISRGD